MHRSRWTCRVNRWRRGSRKGESREGLCCGCTGSRLINDELFFFVEDHRSRIGDFCRSSWKFGNVLLLHCAIDSLHEVALCFTSLLWLLSALVLSAACSLSIATVVVVVGMVTCIFTALAPCVSGTRVNRARSVVRYAEAGDLTGGVFTPSLRSLSLLLSLGRSVSIVVTMATAAPTVRPLVGVLSISRFVSSSSPLGRSALSCIIRIFNPFCQGFLLREVHS